MRDEIRHHVLSYFFLIGGLGFFTVLFYINRLSRGSELNLGIIASLFYFVWGIVHHGLEKNLNIKIVIEYGLISLLGVAMLFGLFY